MLLTHMTGKNLSYMAWWIFYGKVLYTLKMDAHNQLLFSEGVGSQLGIVECHQNVWPDRKLPPMVSRQEIPSKTGLSVKNYHRLYILW